MSGLRQQLAKPAGDTGLQRSGVGTCVLNVRDIDPFMRTAAIRQIAPQSLSAV